MTRFELGVSTDHHHSGLHQSAFAVTANLPRQIRDRMWLLTFLLLLILPSGAFAQGSCPTAANYLNPSTGNQVTLASLGVTSCYYISTSGSDSNSGTAESSPWQHAPGMIGCSANCALIDKGSGDSGNAKPGEGFILRGGDVWHSQNLPWTWRSAGKNGSPIYLGVDKAWYSGSSWTRPILNMDNSTSSEANITGSAFQMGGGNQAPFTQLDNIEFTGLYSCQSSGSGTNGYVQLNSPNDSFTNNYLHAWTHCSTPNVPDGCQLVVLSLSSGQSGYSVEYNVWDGSDSTNGGDSCFAMYEAGSDATTTVAYNYIRNVANGIVGQYPIVHDNTILNINQDYAQLNGHGEYHGNAFENNVCQSPCVFYNNVIANVNPNAGVTFWDSPSGNYDYIFNNVVVNTTDGNVMDTLTGSGFQAFGGYVKEFNNTVECGQDSTTPSSMCSGDSTSSSKGSSFLNNHYITSATAPLSYWGTQTNNVTQTKSAANGQSYSLNNSFAFSPTASSGSTIGAGANEQSLCQEISGLDAAAGAACQKDTTYGVSYNASNHTAVWPARSPVSRPASGSWDVGAYQFSGNGSQPQPPTHLVGSAH